MDPSVTSSALRPAIVDELRRVLSPPYEAPVVVAVNGLLMAAAWFLLPVDWLFRLHDPRVFPVCLAVWMYADVPATNVLGADAGPMSALLGRSAELRTVLAARALVLSLLVTPVCLVVAVSYAATSHESPLTLVTTVSILALSPLGLLAVAQWLGVLLPYHVLPLVERWRGRRRFGPMVARWLLLVLLPYAWVPTVACVFTLPVVAARQALLRDTPLSDAAILAGVVLALLCLTTVLWRAGLGVSLLLVRRREAALRGFLTDPTRG